MRKEFEEKLKARKAATINGKPMSWDELLQEAMDTGYKGSTNLLDNNNKQRVLNHLKLHGL